MFVQDGTDTKSKLAPDTRKGPARATRRVPKESAALLLAWPDSDVDVRLTIAEGIETALTAAHAGPPVWACVDADNMAKLPVLAGIETLLLVADNDIKGRAAARACAQRWDEAGREVWIYKASEQGADLNDEITGARNGR